MLYSFINLVSCFIQSANDVPFHACYSDLAPPMSLYAFHPSRNISSISEDILLQDDKIIDTFLNVTLPSLHSSALSSRDDALVNDEFRLISNFPKLVVEQIPSSKSSTYHNKLVNVICLCCP